MSGIGQRIGFSALAATVILALCLAATAAPAASRARCLPAGAHTLAVDREARVFSWHAAIYGCVEATGKRRNLGRPAVCNLRPGRVAPVKLVGVLAAYGLESCGVDTGASTVVVLDLASGRRLADLPAATLMLGAESYVSVQSLVLRGDGAVGWIARDESLVGGRGAVYEVHRYAGASSALLDSGAAIDPTSLRLVGPRMSWRHGNRTRSAQL